MIAAEVEGSNGAPPPGRSPRLPGFDDRRDAGRRLAAMLGRQTADAVVIGIAAGGGDCGGVIVAAEVAAALAAPLDAFAVARVHDASAAREAALLELALHEGFGALELDGRKVILVDDAIVTGTTITTAVDRARRLGASRVVIATPVASVEGLRRVLGAAGEMTCLHTVPVVTSVEAWFRSSEGLEVGDAVRAIVQNRRQRPVAQV